MKLKLEDCDQACLLTVRGEITAEDTDQLRKVAIERMDRKLRDFVLDLSQTEFIDSKGLETLLWLQEEAMAQLGQVRLAACQETVTKILEITRLSKRFETHETIEAAIRSLR